MARTSRTLEGADNPSILVSQWDTSANSAQITATHWGYEYLTGQPVLTRSMWYDLNGTILIADWGDSTTSHTFQQSFNLQTEGDTNNVSVDAANFTARTRYSSGENVMIQGLSPPGQTSAKGAHLPSSPTPRPAITRMMRIASRSRKTAASSASLR